jgi:hypothetical protein
MLPSRQATSLPGGSWPGAAPPTGITWITPPSDAHMVLGLLPAGHPTVEVTDGAAYLAGGVSAGFGAKWSRIKTISTNPIANLNQSVGVCGLLVNCLIARSPGPSRPAPRAGSRGVVELGV